MTKKRGGKVITSRGNAKRVQVVAPPVTMIHPTLTSQFHKSERRQFKDARISKGESYNTPKDWSPPRGG